MLLRRGLFCLPVLFLSFGVEAQGGACLEQARTPLEQTYCKIRAANPSAPLPTLQELRRNPEKTQRLLLRRPAEQAGISLPPEKTARPAPTAPAKSASMPAAAATRAALPTRIQTGGLAGCELLASSIRCGADRYQLQGNMPNSRLARGALDLDTKVSFAEYQGAAADSTALQEYASSTYRRYIEAMLEIGLGSSTMSFTKFYHTFTEAQEKGTRFGERLSAMFDFLKKDKANMGVQSHYNDALPSGIEQCMSLSEALLVCDNVQQNWVYKRAAL
ncbi:MAG: hypothetical protein NVV73_18665 [Cellvibrionaceae bacterium]|nr:hypothetical protein [Cellvibrionaceae bacterium]